MTIMNHDADDDANYDDDNIRRSWATVANSIDFRPFLAESSAHVVGRQSNLHDYHWDLHDYQPLLDDDDGDLTMIFQESTAPFTSKKKLLPINPGSPQSSFDFPIFLNCLFAHFFVHARIIGIVKFCIENRKPLCLCSSCQRHRPAIKDSFNIPTHPLSPITTFGDLVSGPAPKLI